MGSIAPGGAMEIPGRSSTRSLSVHGAVVFHPHAMSTGTIKTAPWTLTPTTPLGTALDRQPSRA